MSKASTKYSYMDPNFGNFGGLSFSMKIIFWIFLYIFFSGCSFLSINDIKPNIYTITEVDREWVYKKADRECQKYNKKVYIISTKQMGENFTIDFTCK